MEYFSLFFSIALLATLFFVIPGSIVYFVIAARHQKKIFSEEEDSDVSILLEIIKLSSDPSFSLDVSERKLLISKFDKVRHRLSSDEISSLIRILFTDN